MLFLHIFSVAEMKTTAAFLLVELALLCAICCGEARKLNAEATDEGILTQSLSMHSC